jgi:hypothetical protein
MVGLPETAVRESKERVRSALLTAEYSFPPGRITVNLSPADLPKEGGRFDLPIAVGILAASGQLPRRALARREFYGELALGGELRETSKLLPALMAGTKLILPAANSVEAGLIAYPKVRLAHHLIDVCNALKGGAPGKTKLAADTFGRRPPLSAAARISSLARHGSLEARLVRARLSSRAEVGANLCGSGACAGYRHEPCVRSRQAPGAGSGYLLSCAPVVGTLDTVTR